MDAFGTTLTNKTMTAAANTFSGFAIGTEVTGASTDLTDTAVIVRTDQANVMGDFDFTLKDNRLRIENPAGTFEVQFLTSAELADRVLTIPLLGANRTMVVTGLANQIGDTEIAAHTSTKITITAKGQLNSAIVYNDQTNVFGDFNQDFKDNRIRIFNPADTFAFTIIAPAIVAARNLTLPLLTGNDIVVTEAFAQALTNKTIDGDLNTIIDINETQQNVSVGVSGTVLTSNGVGVAPTYQTAAGGEFTGAWTADHNQGGSAFGLQDALFVDPTVTTKKLQIDLAGMTAAITAILDFNFTTAKTITFPDVTDTLAVKGANTFTATQTLGTNILQFVDANTTITAVTNDLEYDVATANEHRWRIANGTEMTLDATSLTLATNRLDLALGAPVRWGNNSNLEIFINAGGIEYKAGSGDTHEFFIGGPSEMTLSATTLNIGTNILQFVDANTTITAVTNDLEYDVATGEEHRFRVNNATELVIDGSVINAATNTFQEAGIDISPIGTHDDYFDAGNIVEVTSAVPDTVLIGTTGNRKGVLKMNFGAADEFATIKLTPPRNWDAGTITVIFKWTSGTEAAGTVIWGVSGVAVSDLGDLAAAATNYGTEVTVTDTQTNINEEQFSPRTAAVTLANTPTAGDSVYLKIRRDGAVDTFGQIAFLLGVFVEWTINAATAT